MPILNLSKVLEEMLSCNLRSTFLLKSFKNLLIEQVSKISKSSKGLSASILSVIPCKIAIFPCFVFMIFLILNNISFLKIKKI